MVPKKYSIIFLLLIKVLRSSCKGTSSLTFVIDDTLSMWNDIEQVKVQVDQIMDVALEEKSSEIKDFVLVSFNDPDITLVDKTSNRASFRRSVYSLRAHNNINVDCPEMAMGGIKRALEESSPGSYIYVFTDASAKDYLYYMEVIDLCQRKQSQVVFVLTGDCRSPESRQFAVFYTVAAACSGQVFKINKNEVSTMIDVIRVRIRGKNSLLTSRVVPPHRLTSIPFTIDDKVKSVLITTSGENVTLKIRAPGRHINARTLMWTDNSKAIELTDPESGEYSAVVSGHSSTSVVITGRTDFSFHHGFSVILPKAASETVTQPIADEVNFLSITINDPDNDVTIEKAQILDMNENILLELPLYKISENFFTTDQFSSPNHMIQIAVKGTLKRNGQTVRRISKTPVQPKIITIPPVIDKSHTTFETTNASTIKIPCKILAAKPKPIISWYFKTISSLSYETLPETGDVLTVNVNDASLSHNFKCVAKNEAGQDEHVTELIVTMKPRITINKGSKISVKYGGTISISCHAFAKPEPRVVWKNENNVVIPAQNQVNQDGTSSILTLHNIRASKKYYCYSSNTRGLTTESVDVTVLSPFRILGSREETINLEYGKSYMIPCKIESELPVKIKWYFTPEQNSNMESLKPSDKYYVESNGSALIIKYMDLDLRGKYRCSATLLSDENLKDSYDVNLNIHDLAAPQLTTSANPLIVKEKTPATLSCKILKGVPKPTVTWYFKSNEVDTFQRLENVGEQLHIQSATLSNAGIYKIVATNIMGTQEVTSELIVQVPPVIDKSQTTIETTNASTIKIPCKILAAKPKPIISWYFKTVSSVSYEPLPETGDVLTVNVNDASLSRKFKCVAKNEAGRDEHVTELIVTMKPRIIIDKGSKISVKYGGTISIVCHAFANPEPRVEWQDGNNVVIPAYTQVNQNGTSSILTLHNIRVSKKYYCYSSNTRGSTTESVDVTVLSPFRILGSREETMNLEYGKSYMIPCKIESELPVKIKWYFTPEQNGNMESLKSSDKYYVESNGSTLIIKYMDLDLRGKYRCSATLISDENLNESYDVNVNIHDLAAPQLTTSANPLIVIEKTPATLSCKILKGVPKPTVTWYFKSNEVDTFQRLENVGEQLHIQSVTLSNAGVYKIVATNIMGTQEVTSKLIVQAPPRINNNVKIFKGVIGDVTLRIPCNVTGYPKPDISWSDRKGGENIVQDEKYSINDGALVIKNPVPAHTKTYWCTAINVFGSDTQSFNGVVTDEIDYENVHEVHILEGETKKVECPLPHTPTDSVRWYKNGNLMNVTGPYLDFVNATVFMDANYTCRVSNSLESNSDTILVIVGYKPTFTIITDSNITDWKGEGDLNCEVSAKPTPVVEWLHNGKPLESAKYNFQIDIFDWGVYSCHISNVHGTVERTFTVSSEACLVNADEESVQNTPVILSESSAWPSNKIVNNYLNFDSGEKFKLLCPNTSNGLQNFPGKNEIDVTCDHEDKFLFDGKSYKYSDFHCDKQVMPVIQKTGSRCLAENSETIRVGFSGKSFIEGYEVCLDTHENLPLYTHMTLTNARYHADKDQLKWFKHPEIESGKQDKVYTCDDNITSCCYTKGQFVNASDVTFGPLQTSTYIDHLNAVPIWLPCTERTSWSEIEDVIRTQTIIQDTFSVWSGASKYTELNGGKIPRYLWKVVKGSEDIIAVIYVNEPSPKDDDIFCQNICDGNSMLWLTPKDKFTYCCTLEDFTAAFELSKSIFA